MKSSDNPNDLTLFINKLQRDPEKTLSDYLEHSKFSATDNSAAKLTIRLVKLAEELNKGGDLGRKIVEFGLNSLSVKIKLPIDMVTTLGSYSRKNNAIKKSMDLYAKRLKSPQPLPKTIVDDAFKAAVAWGIMEAVSTVFVAAKDATAIAVNRAIQASPVLNPNHQLRPAFCVLVHGMVPANYFRAAQQAAASKTAAAPSPAPKPKQPSSTAAVVKKMAVTPKQAPAQPRQTNPKDFGKAVAAKRVAQRNADFIAVAKQPQKVPGKVQGLAKAKRNDAIRAQRDKAHQEAARKQAQPKLPVKAAFNVNLTYGGNSPKEVGKAMEADARQARDDLKKLGKKVEHVGKKVGRVMGWR